MSPVSLAIKTVAVLDDSEDVRAAISEKLADDDYQPVSLTGPLATLDQLVQLLPSQAQAAVCDYQLSTHGNYATFNGAQFVSRCYQQRSLPCVLRTSYVTSKAEHIRVYRRYIPALIQPSEATSDAMAHGWETCLSEWHDRYRPGRKPWRTLVRIEEREEKEKRIYVVVPAWNPDEKICLLDSNLGSALPRAMAGARLFAQVNIGAESQEELYFVFE